MSILNRGRSPLGAWIRSPLGVKTIDDIYGYFKVDYGDVSIRLSPTSSCSSKRYDKPTIGMQSGNIANTVTPCDPATYQCGYTGDNNVPYVFSAVYTGATHVGDSYSNNGATFTITNLSGGTTITCIGTGTPSTSGILTRVTGSGDLAIAFTSFTGGGGYRIRQGMTYPLAILAAMPTGIKYTISGVFQWISGAASSVNWAIYLSNTDDSGLYSTTTNSKASWDWEDNTDILLGSGTVMRFLVFMVPTGANATIGDTYTNNGETFTITATASGTTVVLATGTGFPTSSGTLTKASGMGDSTITFSSVTTAGQTISFDVDDLVLKPFFGSNMSLIYCTQQEVASTNAISQFQPQSQSFGSPTFVVKF